MRAQSAGAWVKLNAGQTGYYRVQYPAAQWASLTLAATQFSNGQPLLSQADVAGLIDDAFHLAQIGAGDIGTFLNLTQCALLLSLCKPVLARQTSSLLDSVSYALCRPA